MWTRGYFRLHHYHYTFWGCFDSTKVGYNRCTELMEYVGPYHIYKYWIWIVQYTKSMRRYGLAANYIQLKNNDQNKGATIYIDGRPKETGNIAGFINSTRPVTKNKWPNCIFEGREGNHVFVCAIKSIAAGEEILIDYNLNRIDKDVAIMGAVRILIYPTCKQWLLYWFHYVLYNVNPIG